MATANYPRWTVNPVISSITLLFSIALLPIAQAASCGSIANFGYSACAVTCVLGPLIGTYAGCAQGDFACICNQPGWRGAVTDCTPCACPSLGANMASLTSSICNAVQDTGGSPDTVTTTRTLTVTQSSVSYYYYTTTASAITYITTTFTADPTTVVSTAGGGQGFTNTITITSCPGSSTGTIGLDDSNATCSKYVSTPVAAGIGVGSAIAGIALAALIVALLCRRRQKRSRRPKDYPSYVALTPSSGTLPPRTAPYKYPDPKQAPVQGYMQVPQSRQDMAATRAVSPNSSSTAWSAPAPSWMHEADANGNAYRNGNGNGYGYGYGRGQPGGGRPIF